MLRIIWLLLCTTPVYAADFTQAVAQVPGGTGFLAENSAGRRYLITNWHVCRHFDEGRADVRQGYSYTARVIERNDSWDLCALSAPNFDVLTLKLAKSAQPGEWVRAAGYPEEKYAITQGFLRNEYRWHVRMDGITHWFTSVDTTMCDAPGSSGSPVVDSENHLVAVISNYERENLCDAGAVPFSMLRVFLESL